MTAIVHLECDACGTDYEGGAGMSTTEVREDAASMDGWACQDGRDRDFCMDCKGSAS